MSRKVLVVEDNPDIANLVSLHLKDLDCEVRIATDGVRGWMRRVPDTTT